MFVLIVLIVSSCGSPESSSIKYTVKPLDHGDAEVSFGSLSLIVKRAGQVQPSHGQITVSGNSKGHTNLKTGDLRIISDFNQDLSKACLISIDLPGRKHIIIIGPDKSVTCNGVLIGPFDAGKKAAIVLD
jgi:hypothetical protein